MSQDLKLALRLADAADAISTPRFRSGLTVETKPDLTPVTEADRAVEAELRRLLAEERPDDAILGEEEGESGSSARRWILDPIDATRNYARGNPVWGTLIALEESGRVRLGVVSAPLLGRRWWAERDAGAWADGERMAVSAVSRVEDAVLSFPLDRAVPDLARRAWNARGFGDFWAHMLVAEGAVDGAIDSVSVREWDLAAVQVIVEEAGGRFSDFSGESRIDGGSAVSSNGRLHDELLAAVAGSLPCALDRRCRLGGGRHALLTQPTQDVVDVGDLLLEILLALLERFLELFAIRSTLLALASVVSVVSSTHGQSPPFPARSRNAVRPSRRRSTAGSHDVSTSRPSSVSVYVRFAGPGSSGLHSDATSPSFSRERNIRYRFPTSTLSSPETSGSRSSSS